MQPRCLFYFAGAAGLDRLHTYAATRRILSSPSVSLNAGIAVVPSAAASRRPLVTVSVIVACEPPHSQILSVRFGAPSAMLPLPSGPWHAAQFCENSGLPSCDF